MCKEPINGEDYAPITQALRGRLKVAALGLSSRMVEGLRAECDNIDAIHKALEQENADMRDFCERVEQAAQARENVTLWGVDYAALPLDADGMPIHFGDVLDQFGTPMTVWAMSDPDPNQGDCMLELITDGISDGTWVRARKMRHYHESSVEDVLRKFYTHAVRGKEAHAEDVDGNVLAEYAAKLRLAGDAE